MGNVLQTVETIKATRKQRSVSHRDEIAVAQEFLNNPDYVMDVYKKGAGKVGTFCPRDTFNKMNAMMIGTVAHVKPEEAAAMAAGYKVTKVGAECFVDLTKNYMNTYLDTGRKFALPGTAEHCFAFAIKEVDEGIKKYPATVASKDGKTYSTVEKKVPAHISIRAWGSCPDYIK